jgi:opacity protein-like surface antigen
MTNKTTKICCTLALLASVAATPALSQAKNFAGPSIAIGAGYNSLETPVKLKETTSDDPALVSTLTFGGSKQNFNYLADISYGIEMNKDFVMSLGATYDFNKSESEILSGTDEDDNTASLKGKLKDHYSVYLQPTYLINSSTGIFAKASYNFAKASYTIASGGDSLSISDDVNGWGYGLGIKSFLNNNLFIQAEGSLTKYDKTSKTLTGESGSVYDVSSEPEVLSAIISIGYKF